MKQKSIWLDGFSKSKQNLKFKDNNVDILIIGAGMAGMSTAFYLKDSKQKIMLIDKGTIGFGVTAYTTAKITYLQETIYQKIEKAHNFDTAKLYLASQKEALKEIENNINKYNIDCNFKKSPSYTVSNKKETIDKEKEFFKKCNEKFLEIDNLNLPFKYGLGIENSATFHPLKYLYAIKEIIKDKIFIYENTKATKIEKEHDYYIIDTNRGQIKAKKIVVANHYPFFILPGLIPLQSHIEKSYVVAAKEKNKDFNMISTDGSMHSIRFYKDYILYGNESHYLTDQIDTKKHFENIQNNFKKWNNSEIEYMWANQDIITNDSLPYIGELRPNLYIATGFQTWGMTNGTIAGKVIADLILKQESPYESLFSIHRNWNLNRVKNCLLDILHYGKIFVQTTIIKNPKFYKDNVRITYENGKRIGIYLDQNGIEHKVLNKCPHMKCNLIFNKKEKTWDCPCHSSRFDIDGNIIKGPSVSDIKLKD